MPLFGRGNLTVLQKIQRVLRGSRDHRTTALDDNQTFDWTWEERRDLYRRWESLYANSIYQDQADGGFREIILREDLGINDTTRPLHGFYNPVGVIVDAYQNVLRGQFGREITIAETVENKPVNERLAGPISQIWKWSNFNNRKEVFQTFSANLGTCGLRIDVEDSSDPRLRRVRIQPVHPREIVDYDEDPEGNIVGVVREYGILEGGMAEARDDQITTYREVLTKEKFVLWREGRKVHESENTLGICPFVLNRHKTPDDAEFGMPAWYGSDKIIHQINWLITRMGISVDRNVFPKWFAAASGAQPTSFELGDATVAYVQTQPGDTRPMLEAVVAKLDFVGVNQVLMGWIAHIRHRQPELTLAYLEALSGQSGETIAKLLTPCQERILVARGHYEHSLVRAMQIALSFGIGMKMWDIGTGDDANRAFHDGFEDFAFNERPALPQTVYDEKVKAEVKVAPVKTMAEIVKSLETVVSRDEQLRLLGSVLGYDEARIAKIKKEKVALDVIPELAQ